MAPTGSIDYKACCIRMGIRKAGCSDVYVFGRWSMSLGRC